MVATSKTRFSAESGANDLDLLADDALSAAGDVLDRHTSTFAVRIVGVEFGRHPHVSVLVSGDEATPPRVMHRWAAMRADAELVHAAELLAIGWLNALPESTRVVVGAAIDISNASLRIYARPATADVALAIRHQGVIVEIARRAVAHAESIH
jgi:hypothetical protein